MKVQWSSEKDRYARLKLGLVPVLLLVFGYILFGPAAETLPKQVASEIVPETIATPVSSRGVAVNPSKKLLPQISLLELETHDPFQLLAILQPEAVAVGRDLENKSVSKRVQAPPQQLELIKETLRPRVVQGIIISEGKKAVFIDSQLYYEGDMLEQGVYIRQINPRNVVLSIDEDNRNPL